MYVCTGVSRERIYLSKKLEDCMVSGLLTDSSNRRLVPEINNHWIYHIILVLKNISVTSFRLGFCPDPLGELTTLPRPHSRLGKRYILPIPKTPEAHGTSTWAPCCALPLQPLGVAPHTWLGNGSVGGFSGPSAARPSSACWRTNNISRHKIAYKPSSKKVTV